MKEEEKDLNYWKENAKDAYMTTPICVLRYITELENAVKNNAVLPHVSGSLPIEELRCKLLSMRFSKEEMRNVDNENAFEMYGFTDCINQLLEWLQPKKQIVEMLINCNDIITALTQAKNCVIPAIMGELTCDNCGCHPTVIFTTSKGRFCERCKPAS